MDELVSIGDFAARCGLSPKMLRSYAAAGLLLPAAVDRFSGYRYYDIDQLPRARIIGLLRQAGIPLDAIAGFLHNPDPAQLDRWDSQLLRDAASRREALANVRSALTALAPPTPNAPETSPKGPTVAKDFHAGAATSRGGRRANQDAVLVSARLFAVADGIGGLHAGEVASRVALGTLEVSFAREPTAAGLLKAGQDANAVLWHAGTAGDAAGTMGTTLTAVAATGEAMALVHVGDSRAYRVRDGRLRRLTQDHTVVADLVRDGSLTEEQACAHPQRHLLTRALGVDPSIEIDSAQIAFRPEDRFLLCTDGVFKTVPADTLVAILTSGKDPQATADAIVADALNRGADDNVTALIVAPRAIAERSVA